MVKFILFYELLELNRRFNDEVNGIQLIRLNSAHITWNGECQNVPYARPDRVPHSFQTGVSFQTGLKQMLLPF